MSKSQVPAFPLRPNVWYSFQQFLDFEAELLAARQADRKLSDTLRVSTARWLKTRNEELYPAWYLCRHLGFPATTRFRIGLPGATSDIDIAVDGQYRHLQITTTGPIWPEGHKNWGLDHRLHMEQLNRGGQSSGWGPYFRAPDGSITNRDEAISNDERDPAHLRGLTQALASKQTHQLDDCDLVVYAKAYDQAMSIEAFQQLAEQACKALPLRNFRCTHIVSANEGYYYSGPHRD